MKQIAKRLAFGAAGLVCLLAAPSFAEPLSLPEALDSLDVARRALTDALFRGDAGAMDRAGSLRERSLAALEASAMDPERIRSLPFDARAVWLETALRERRPEWSRAILASLNQGIPEPSEAGRLALAMGLAAETLGDTLLARNSFEAAAEHHALLADEALHRLWKLSMASGDTAGALVFADSLATSHPESPRTPLVRLDRARALREHNAPQDALAEVRLASPDWDGAEIRWFIAETQLALGRPDEAAHELEELILRFASEPRSVEAYTVRDTMSVPLSPETRLDLLAALLAQPASDAPSRVRAFAESDSLDPALQRKALLTLTRYLYRAKQYADAETLLTSLRDDPDPATAEEATIVLARIHRNTGRVESMRVFYETVIDSAGAEAPTALWEMGRELESNGAWEEASIAFSRLLERYPEHERARDARFRRGFDMVRLGRLEEASEDFRGAFQKSPLGPDGEQAAFWLARTLKDLGRDEEALNVARAGAISDRPEDLYGVLLRERFELGFRSPDLPTSSLLDPSRPLSDLASRDWPPEARDRFHRGLALASLGVKDAARAEWFRALLAGADSTMIEVLALCAVAYDVYPEGVRWAKLARDRFPEGHGSRAGYDRLFYPGAYHSNVVREGEVNGIDPHLLWALIRQESFYDPGAVSRAGARGLMQVMPATLDRMIQQGTAHPALSADALFRPDVNIELGTRFFAERLAEFEGELLPTLASYNAGEGKAHEWQELAGGDSEEVFVECVGYRETHGYVRRIPWLAWLYGAYYDRGKIPDTAGSEAR